MEINGSNHPHCELFVRETIEKNTTYTLKKEFQKLVVYTVTMRTSQYK